MGTMNESVLQMMVSTMKYWRESYPDEFHAACAKMTALVKSETEALRSGGTNVAP